MNPVTLNPMTKQLFQVTSPQNSRPRISVLRILHVRFCRWLDKASPQAVWKAVKTAGTLAAVSLPFVSPREFLATLSSAASWNGYRIPFFLAVLSLTLNARRIWRWAVRARIKEQARGNQHTYHGIPVPEFASWLIERKAFKIEEATDKWAFSKDKYYAIANELDKHGLLTRGEKNARVLRDISYADLVYQLKNGRFPLVWDEISESWVEKDDPYGRHLREKSFRARKLEETTERKERKVERLDRAIEERRTAVSVADVLSLAG